MYIPFKEKDVISEDIKKKGTVDENQNEFFERKTTEYEQLRKSQEERKYKDERDDMCCNCLFKGCDYCCSCKCCANGGGSCPLCSDSACDAILCIFCCPCMIFS